MNQIKDENSDSIFSDILSFQNIRLFSIEIIGLAWPTILTYLVIYVIDSVNYHYLGQLTPLSVSAYAIGYSVIRLSSVTYVIGINTAIDSLVSQYYGMKNYDKCSSIFYLGIIVCNLFCIPWIFIAFYSYSLLKLLHIEEEISINASKFVSHAIFYVVFFVNYDALRRFLGAQKIMKPQFFVSAFNSILQIFHCYYLVKYYGFLGALASTTITNGLNIILLSLYIWYSGICKSTLAKFDFREIIETAPEYFSKAIPGGINFGSESISFHVLNLFSATLSVEYSALNAIFVNMSGQLYSIALGGGAAICSLVGNSLGENKGSVAKLYSIFGIFVIILINIFVVISLLIFQNQIGAYFTTDPGVFSLFLSHFYLPLISLTFYNLQGVASRILIGMGCQKNATLIVLIGYFGLSIPLAFILKDILYVKGIWIASLAGYFLIFVLELVIILRIDFLKVASETVEKNNRSKAFLISTSKELNTEMLIINENKK